MADQTVKDLTFSLTTIIQFLSPIIMGIIGIVGWMLKRMIGKMEDAVEDCQNDIDAVRKASNDCREARNTAHTQCIDKIGKIGSRVSRIEGHLNLPPNGGTP